MAYSYNSYTGDGVVTNFSLTFSYLSTNDVQVYLDGILQTEDVVYTWLTGSVISFYTAPAEGVSIRIERHTTRDERKVDFTTGSVLDDVTLDLDSNQLFYLMQEAFDWIVKAQAEDSAVFVEQDAIKDTLIGQLEKSHFAGDLYHAQYYLENQYMTDAIYVEDEEGVYDHGVYAVGSYRIGLVEDTIDLMISDIDGNTGEVALLANEFFAAGLYAGEFAGFVERQDCCAVECGLSH